MPTYHHPLPEPSLHGYAWSDPASLEDWDQLREECERVSEPCRCLGLSFGLFKRTWLLRAMEQLLMDMIDHPTFVEELLDGILDFHFRAMDITVDRLPMEDVPTENAVAFIETACEQGGV